MGMLRGDTANLPEVGIVAAGEPARALEIPAIGLLSAVSQLSPPIGDVGKGTAVLHGRVEPHIVVCSGAAR